ncbi:MAG: hypothetical protein K2Q18_01110 [Bdellovibrionales bacterium]|nr:hypothetical protein [Bdellovibrionales bacterium]
MKVWVLFSIIALSTACIKQSESITPIAPVSTIADLQREALMGVANSAGQSELSANARSSLDTTASDPTIFYLNIKYNMKNIDVFEAANMPNTFEKIGSSFLKTLAKVFLSMVGSMNVNIADIDLNVPDIAIDRSVIKSFKIKRIFLTYNKELDVGSDYLANFSFVNNLELSRKVTVPKVGEVETLFLSYRKNRNMCLFKCLQFDILEDNLIDILKPNTNIKLRPSLSISSLPAINDLKLDGEIEMQIGLKLPF